MAAVSRIFVEKKQGYDVEAKGLYRDLSENLHIDTLTSVRVINRYDVAGLNEEEFSRTIPTVFSEPQVDDFYLEEMPQTKGAVFAYEYLTGQYDQRADSAAQCIQILTQKERPLVKTAKIIVLGGDISAEQLQRVKKYCINPVECQEASFKKPDTLEMDIQPPEMVERVAGFIGKTKEELMAFLDDMGMAMDLDDILFCQSYFKEKEQRDPTLTELRMIDTYWSDHCRHTTFSTELTHFEIENPTIEQAFENYKRSRNFVYDNRKKSICLMDIATIAMKEIKKNGFLPDLDESEEINACSIVVDVDVDGKPQKWLVMFKNETHNHPTEIEPFGGAATCLGGAIRDPLSGRSFVYQAMRITGSGDPTVPVSETLANKLPQSKIARTAAAGYSSYGNQIGLATGLVSEIYDEGYVAKHMELGAVIAAAPQENVIRKAPKAGDVVILLGGRTGRDGCGGATGSSKAHDAESLTSCGAEVQKGNAPEERKIQRLFRNPSVTTLIKRCNDFGAGGVSVAIGELADGLVVNLDKVSKKYEGLDGTELAISESQERMAVVVAREDASAFIQAASNENLEAAVVAEVTDHNRLTMLWRGNRIVDIDREFLNSNGAKKYASVSVRPFAGLSGYFAEGGDTEKELNVLLRDLNFVSQKGLAERFDASIGGGTVFMPFGGKYQLTPAQAACAKIPVMQGETNTATVMSYGYDPKLSRLSPYHGAIFAVMESVAKAVATGCNYKDTRLTLQEYFEKLGTDPIRWGKPFSALLGAYEAQRELNIPAIGGKDSMSGSFLDLDVPPTVVSIAVNYLDARYAISNELKQTDSKLICVPVKLTEEYLPDFHALRSSFVYVHNLIKRGVVYSAQAVSMGGIAGAVLKASFGNKIGVSVTDTRSLYAPLYGSIVLEVEKNLAADPDFAYELGTTNDTATVTFGGVSISIDKAIALWEDKLEKVYPTKTDKSSETLKVNDYKNNTFVKASESFAHPRVFVPVFPGTNCEYDIERAFSKAGAVVDTFVFHNLAAAEIDHSIRDMAKRIAQAQIVMIPGGFSAGDEPDGSGKFIATAFKNPLIREEITKLLEARDGLMLGICNGFQALIKLGLVPFGKIIDVDDTCPTLTYNSIGRHVSCMVQTRVSSNKSPWLYECELGEMHTVAVSHGEGRFVCDEKMAQELFANGQVATQYVNFDGTPSIDIAYNPNGAMWAIEGITSPDGRVFGKMGHSERFTSNTFRNISGEKDQKIFLSGVKYFR